MRAAHRPNPPQTDPGFVLAAAAADELLERPSCRDAGSETGDAGPKGTLRLHGCSTYGGRRDREDPNTREVV